MGKGRRIEDRLLGIKSEKGRVGHQQNGFTVNLHSHHVCENGSEIYLTCSDKTWVFIIGVLGFNCWKKGVMNSGASSFAHDVFYI